MTPTYVWIAVDRAEMPDWREWSDGKGYAWQLHAFQTEEEARLRAHDGQSVCCFELIARPEGDRP